MFGHAVEKHYRVVGQDRNTVVVQRKELMKRITEDRTALFSQTAGVPPILLESASAVNIQNKYLEEASLLFCGI